MTAKLKFNIRRQLNRLFLLVTILVVSSCRSNEFYIDFDKQLVCSANSKGIMSLSFKSDSDNKQISWGNWRDKRAPTKVSITPLTKGYVVMCWKDNTTYIKLRNNTIYTIDREQGDAGGCHIKVLTDSNGRFLKLIP